MTEVLSLVVPLFGLVILGGIAGQSPVLATNGRRVVDWLLFNLALPALLFHIVANAPDAALSNWSFFFTVTFGTYCAFALAFTFAALRNRGDIRVGAIHGALGSHSSIAYLGPALVLPAFGPAAGLPLALIFLLDGVLIRFLLPILWGIGGRERVPPLETFRRSALSVARQPAFVAVALGVVVAALGWNLPSGVDRAFDLLGSAAAPLGLLALGLALAAYRAASGRLQWSGSLATKLFLHPAIVYLLLSWVGDFDPAWMFSALFLAALPPASGVAAIARASAASEPIDPIAATGAVLSVVTITALVALTVTGAIPADLFVSDR